MSILTYTLIFIALIALSKYLTAKSNEPALEGDVGKVMRADKVFSYMGYLSILLGAVFPVLYYVDVYNRTDSFLVVSLLMLLVFGLMGLYMILYFKNTKVEFNENILRTTNFLGKSKELNWSEIKNIKYRPITKWLSIENEKIQLNIPVILKGFGSFKKELITKVSAEKYQKALESITS